MPEIFFALVVVPAAILLFGLAKALVSGNGTAKACMIMATLLFGIILFAHGPTELFVAIIPLTVYGFVAQSKDTSEQGRPSEDRDIPPQV